MNINFIKKIIKTNLTLKKLIIKKDGDNFKIIAVSDKFIGLSKLERHKLIYFPLTKYILNNSIHSVSIYTYSTQEWETNK